MLYPEQLATMAGKAQAHVKANYDWSKITADNLAVYDRDFGIVESTVDSSQLLTKKSLT